MWPCCLLPCSVIVHLSVQEPSPMSSLLQSPDRNRLPDTWSSWPTSPVAGFTSTVC